MFSTSTLRALVPIWLIAGSFVAVCCADRHTSRDAPTPPASVAAAAPKADSPPSDPGPTLHDEVDFSNLEDELDALEREIEPTAVR